MREDPQEVSGMKTAELEIDEQARTRFQEDGYWLGPEIFDAG